MPPPAKSGGILLELRTVCIHRGYRLALSGQKFGLNVSAVRLVCIGFAADVRKLCLQTLDIHCDGYAVVDCHDFSFVKRWRHTKVHRHPSG